MNKLTSKQNFTFSSVTSYVKDVEGKPGAYIDLNTANIYVVNIFHTIIYQFESIL